MTTENGTEPRTPGRRPIDSAHLLRWVPFMSLLFLMLIQTILGTRYISSIELTNTQLVTQVTRLETRLEALTVAQNSGAIPSAQNQWRIEQAERQIAESRQQFDRQVSENRQTIADLTRRVSALEAHGRASRER
jgi:hypothetical protein